MYTQQQCERQAIAKGERYYSEPKRTFRIKSK